MNDVLLEAIQSGFDHALTWPAVGLLVVGVMVGCFVGVLPGLGGATAIALLTPLVLPLDPYQAFALLIGVVTVTATTGDLTSILFGIPGEATTAATIVDGHPMARRGEGGQAIGAALGASLAGTVFGGLILTLAIPVSGPLLRAFGSPELFMMALLGISLVAPVSAQSRLTGLIAGGLGLSLAMVGLDPAGATPRYTFGQLFLWDGIGLIPAALGLFAIPEVVALSASGAALAGTAVHTSRQLIDGAREIVPRWRLVLSSSAIGAGVGLVPGIGASVSQWVAYSHAARSPRARRAFGSGAIEGVIGPAAANNATLGGALVPTLAFGVPASLSTAMLLNAMILKGLTPGPNMLLPESQGGQLGLVISLVWLMIAGSLIAVAICFWAAKHLMRITRVSGTLLVPFVLLLTLLGAFAEKNAVEDLFVATAMGGLGLAMIRFGWPRVPLLLGLILGPLAESRFFLSMDAYGAAWILRPGVLLLGGATLLGLTRSVQWRPGVGLDHPAPNSTAPGKAAETGPLPSLVFTLATAGVLATGLVLSGRFPTRAAVFPRLVMLVTLGLTAVQAMLCTRRLVAATDDGRAARRPSEGAIGTVGLWLAVFLATTWSLGFMIGLPLATLMYLRVAARERAWRAVTSSAGAYLFLDLVMVRALGVTYPAGRLLEWARDFSRLGGG